MKKHIKFSPLENRVFGVIGKRKISVEQITQEIYGQLPAGRTAPKIPRNSIVCAIRSINRKLEKKGYKQRINGENRGRYGKIVWIE